MAAHNIPFHATTWWIWALCAAITISIANQLTVVISVIASAILISKTLIVENRGWTSFLLMVRVAIFILVTRIFLQIALGVPVGSHILIRLPEINLPSWFSGLRIGGIVTYESLIASLNDSLRLSALIIVIAAAVSMTVTSRVIQQLPVAFHEIGMVIIIAFTFLPHLFEDVHRIKQASRWRGQSSRGIKTIGQNIVSVSESALERSVRLAAALTVRGYGSATKDNKWRRYIYFGLGIVTLEIIRLLVASTNISDLILFATGFLLIGIGIRKANQSSTRTKYRTESFDLNDFIVILASLMTLMLTLVSFELFAIALIVIFVGFVKTLTPRKMVVQ